MMSLSNNTFRWFDVPCASNTFNDEGAYVVCQRNTNAHNASTPITAGNRDIPSCRTNYTQFQGHCYKFEQTYISFMEAEANCLGEGGHLASIHSQEKEQFLTDLSDGNSVWIGGFPSTNTEGEWFWSDSTPTDLLKVDSYDPTYGCLSLNSTNQQTWPIRPCSENRYIVCKI